MTLAKLAAVTVDDDGKETFVTGGSLDRIQKVRKITTLLLATIAFSFLMVVNKQGLLKQDTTFLFCLS
jgi:hypothetical protein